MRRMEEGQCADRRGGSRGSTGLFALLVVLLLLNPSVPACLPPRLPGWLQVRPSKTSKAFWEAMSKVQNHLTDAKTIMAYNQKKEQKMRVSLRQDEKALAGMRLWGLGVGGMRRKGAGRRQGLISGWAVHRLLHSLNPTPAGCSDLRPSPSPAAAAPRHSLPTCSSPGCPPTSSLWLLPPSSPTTPGRRAP